MISKIILIAFHLLAIALIYILIQPIAQWYLNKIPAIGVDFYYTATYVAYYLQNFSLPFNGFKDLWFGGNPLFKDIFQLSFYLMLPFAKQLGLMEGIRTFVMFALLCFGVFSYFLFYQLSKNIILSLLLVVGIILSVSLYGSATWGGSLPYFTSQMFLPLVLIFIVKYRFTSNRRWFYIAALFSGLGLLTHPLPIVSYVFPATFIILFFWLGEGRYHFFSKVKEFFLFSIISLLISLRLFYEIILNSIKGFFHGDIVGLFQTVGTAGGGPAQSKLVENSPTFYHSLALNLLTDTSILLIYTLAGGVIICFVSLIIFKEKIKSFKIILPFALLTTYLMIQVFVNAYGFNFHFQGWYRAYWAFSLSIGILAAVLWGQFFIAINPSLFSLLKVKLRSWINFLVIITISLFISAVGYVFYNNEIANTIERIDAKSELSSAFPEVVSIKVDKDNQIQLKKTLLPSFINPDDKNKRLYDSDATVNIWWNSFYQMPLARGYIDPPIATSERGGIFWLDIAIANDSLVRDFNVSEDIALANSLFLIDWNSIYYFEGGRESSKGPSTPPSSYLLKNNIFDKEEEVKNYGVILKYQTASGKPELHMEVPQSLRYFKIKDEYTSPVLSATNAKPVLVFSTLAGYEDLLRILAIENINSQKLIPVNAGKYIDALSLEQLKQFDAIFIFGYDYHNKNKAFNNLLKYTEDGGKVFIDTGAEVRESNSDNLPEIFPISKLTRAGIGKSWEITQGQSDLLNNVDVSAFGPLIFNNDEWKISAPSNSSDLRNDTRVILSHKSKPILIEKLIGSGKVIWSGFNLPYHYNQYKSNDEARLMLNIIKQFAPTSTPSAIPAETNWLKPENVRITVLQDKPRGILFKEQGYQGWQAKLESVDDKLLPIYLAGPTYPGYMYVPLPKEANGQIEVVFKFVGTPTSYIIFGIAVATIIILLEKIFLNGLLLNRIIEKKFSWTMKKVRNWWEKEEES